MPASGDEADTRRHRSEPVQTPKPFKLTQSCRPFRKSSDHPFGLLRGRDHVIASSPRRGQATGRRQRQGRTAAAARGLQDTGRAAPAHTVK